MARTTLKFAPAAGNEVTSRTHVGYEAWQQELSRKHADSMA
jgi:hypothetical protein